LKGIIKARVATDSLKAIIVAVLQNSKRELFPFGLDIGKSNRRLREPITAGKPARAETCDR